MNPSSILDSRTQSGVERLCIFGAGGAGGETAWIARQAWGDAVSLIFAVSDKRFVSEPIDNIEVVLLSKLADTEKTRFVAAIGEISLRKKAVGLCERAGMLPIAVVHPRAEMSDSVDLGEGSVVYPGVVATTHIVIGKHAQLNTGCTVSHDVMIGNFSTLSPGCHISGNVSIGRDVFIGAGASVVNGRPGSPLSIGDGAVIAAGACVTKSVAPGALMAGVPAGRKR